MTENEQPAKVTATKKTATKAVPLTARAKPAAAKKSSQAPMQREPLAGDQPYTVTLRPRHAEWVERIARMHGRTVEQQLEKLVREAFAADPNGKTGASVAMASDAGADLANEKNHAAAT